MITFVCGEICSGKSVVANAYAALTNSPIVEIGSIVRGIKNSEDRDVLQDSKALTAEIIKVLQQEEEKAMPKTLIAVGPRQVEIIRKFPHAEFIWIEVPMHVRKMRFNERRRKGDENIAFETATVGDLYLGINDVKKYILETKNQYEILPHTT